MKSAKLKQSKQNCWEFMKCGREMGGNKVTDLGVCPVARETKLNNIHEGHNAGRACWVIAGSLCGGARQGSFANKFVTCEKCAFYQHFRQEEGGRFTLSAVLLSKLKDRKEPASFTRNVTGTVHLRKEHNV